MDKNLLIWGKTLVFYKNNIPHEIEGKKVDFEPLLIKY